MVEQKVKSALKISDDAMALESGRLVLHKPASELLADPDIERLFLGGAVASKAPDITAVRDRWSCNGDNNDTEPAQCLLA